MSDFILEYAVGEESKSNAFQCMRDALKDLNYTDAETYLAVCERDFFYTHHAGDGMSSKLLPKAYRSAKSVLLTALDLGVSIAGKGKSAIEKEYKALRTKDVNVLTDGQIAMKCLSLLGKTTDKEYVIRQIAIEYPEDFWNVSEGD